MKKTATASLTEKTNPTLLTAHALMKVYAQATGAHISILNHNYTLIPEMAGEMLSPKNICLFCIRNQKNIEPKCLQDLAINPCREMHINAIRESRNFGGIYTYVCPLGFIFWTSSIYLNDRFTGALLGSGFLGTDAAEACARMNSMCGKPANESKFRKQLGIFRMGEPRKIKAMAELMQICAQSLSAGSEGCHAAIRRQAEQQSELSAGIADLKSQYPPGSGRPDYPLEKEQKLLEALNRGDVKAGKQVLIEILATLLFSYPDQFKYIQYRAIELAVLISRIDTAPEAYKSTILEANNQNIKLIQEATNMVELTDTLHKIIDNMAGQISSFQGIQHASALKKAENYIMENFTRKISLEEIAGASGFSAPYFSTIFKEEMGENLSSYLNRLRVEKACHMLAETNISLSKIAGACGFEDQSWFSKIFKLYAGMSPGKYRSQGDNSASKIPVTEFSEDYRFMINAKNNGDTK